MLRQPLILLALLVAASVAQQPQLLPTTVIMPWFCLQRCGSTTDEIKAHADQLVSLNASGVPITAVAFEKFNLGPNSTLIDNVLFDMNSYLKANRTLSSLVSQRIAMVSSYPYPPDFLDWMRQLFQTPEPFVDALLLKLISLDMHGVNIDFEPTAAATATDAYNYAMFLKLLRERLTLHGKIMSVDAASWSAIWNLTEIAGALYSPTNPNSVGYMMSMNTYTFHRSIFAEQLQNTVEVFAKYGRNQSLVVGLETWPQNYTAVELDANFALLSTYRICQLAVWDMPIPALMIPYLAAVVRRCS